jgi:tRNA dimethylallyltransferase
VIIAGPTGVGKTKLAIDLALHYKTEIISADSRQFYRELNIGTAKPGKEQLNTVPHHFIGHKSINTLYGSGHFVADALETINRLFREHDTLFVVGGSGLYIDALLHGLDEFEEIPLQVREEINLQFKKRGLKWLQDEVKHADPDFYSTADLRNPQRLLRALEVSKHTGQPYSAFKKGKKQSREFVPVGILLNLDRDVLYQRINNRVDEMMQQGLLDEVSALVKEKDNNALKTVGYKELFEYLEGKWDLKTAIEKIKQHSRNYAKRQLTWFRNRNEFTEFAPGNITGIIQFIDHRIKNG